MLITNIIVPGFPSCVFLPVTSVDPGKPPAASSYDESHPSRTCPKSLVHHSTENCGLE